MNSVYGVKREQNNFIVHILIVFCYGEKYRNPQNILISHFKRLKITMGPTRKS